MNSMSHYLALARFGRLVEVIADIVTSAKNYFVRLDITREFINKEDCNTLMLLSVWCISRTQT